MYTLFLSFLLCLVKYSSSEICIPDDGTFYINDNSQITKLQNCTTIDGNLVIIGEYELNELYLNKLTNITGYLVVMDSHSLHSLKGLKNIESIQGNDLYLNQYSLVIKNNIADDDLGLCYVDTIDWSFITNKSIHLENNNDNCPSCDNNCLGCWDRGPRNCQFCKNYISGITCVNTCPLGTLLDNDICMESTPSNIILSANKISLDSINLNWEFSNGTNGVILGCDIYRNNSLLISEVFSDNSNNYNYSDSNLNNNTLYKYHIYCYNNKNGSYSNFLVLKTKNLENIQNLNLASQSTNSLDFTWDSINVDYYNYMLHSDTVIEGQINDNYISLNNLESFRNYMFMVSGCVGEYCGNYTSINSSTLPSYPGKPQNISNNCQNLNNVIYWEPPVLLNGILEKYEYNLFYNDNLVTNQTTSDNQIILSNLNLFKEYNFQIRASTQIGYGNYSYYNFSSCEGVPETPEIVWNIIERNYNFYIKFNWTNEIINGILTNYSYTIINNKNLSIIGTTLNNEIEIPIIYNTNYSLTLISCNSRFCSNQGELNILTEPGLPPIPNKPKIYDFNESYLKLTIDEVSDINGTVNYIVEYQTLNQNNQTLEYDKLFLKKFREESYVPKISNYYYRAQLFVNTTNHLNTSSGYTDIFIPSIPPTIVPTNPANNGDDGNTGEIVMWVIVGILIILIFVALGFFINKLLNNRTINNDLSNLEGRYKNRSYGPNCAETITSYSNPVYSNNDVLYTLDE